MNDVNRTDNAGRPPLISASFKWLNLTQFLGAMNDNVLKLFIVFFLIGVKGPSEAGAVSATAGAVFVLPFLLFSAWAGIIADRFSKRTVTVSLKLTELAVVSAAAAAFYAGSELGLYAVLFMMAAQSAFFAPSKLGIVPELVEREGLSRANSLLESFTYLAVIIGSALAPLLADAVSARYELAAIFCVAISIVGLAASLRIAPTPAAGSSRPFSAFVLRDIWRAFGYIREDRPLLLAVIGSAFFMFTGSFAQINLIPYGMERLGLTQVESGYLFFAGALAIGAGSLLSGRLSGRSVEFGIVPIGALAITVSSVGLGLVPASLYFVLPAVFLLGFGSGLFIIPLQTFIQMRCPRGRLGEVLAASGFLNWTGVLAAAIVTFVFGAMGMTARQGFMAAGVLTAGLTFAAIKALPDFLIRFLSLVFTRIFYRVRITGEDAIPAEGPALLIPNHVSWADPFFVMAATNRRVRFVMDRGIYGRYRITKAVFDLMGVIPVSEQDSQRDMVSFMKKARTALREGYVLCIFAEGAITRNGTMHEFKPGFEHVVRGTDCPVIPVYLGGLWGSVFSHAHGPLLSSWPKELPRQVTVAVGSAMPPGSNAFELRQAVTELSTSFFESKKRSRRPLGESFVRSARRHWGSNAVSDTSGRRMTYGETLTAAVALADEMDRITAGDENVGLLLPPSVGGALANLSLTLHGKVPVNLNYTAPASSVESAVRLCGIRRIITSRAFVEKTGFPVDPAAAVYIEDVVSSITPAKRVSAWLRASLLPARMLLRNRAFDPDDTAAILFSSGSSGEPKGIMLTHHNIQSNIESIRSVLRLTPDDNIAAALPFFHSLGFTGTLWLPLLSGFSASYHSNPLDGQAVAGMVRENRSTLMLATPTFLAVYARSASRDDLATLRYVVSGAERLRESTAAMFEKRFGVTPYEGYGSTECSPVIALSLPDMEERGVRQKGSAGGSTGRPLPGISVRVVDPGSRAALPAGEPGLILVRGPNVMKGYYNRPELTAAAIVDGWYETGDLGTLSPDGFITITDRLARFCKIGGEMIPLVVIEDVLHSGLGTDERVLAAVTVPDERKGERLVVVYTRGAADEGRLREIMSASGLPNLWRPGRNGYVPADRIPLLGSGKLDLGALKNIADGVTA